MPWLDLLAEYNVYFASIFLSKQWKYGSVDGVEHLGTERADIIEIEFQGVDGAISRRGSEPSARKLWCESHVENLN